MKLPDAEKAQVTEAQVVRYLLSTTHRAGRSKAVLFMEFGFDPNRWEELAQALKQHAMDNEVARIEKTEFGTRYVIDGPLKAADERWLNIRTAWYIDKDGDPPRFVTAHPLRRRRV